MTFPHRPSPRQEELLRAMEEHGPLPDYFHRATVRALLRRGWARHQPRGPGYLAPELTITTRGRWVLRMLDAERAAA